MAKTLRGLGFLLVAVAVWLVLAGAAGWAAEESADSVAHKTGLAGCAAIGAGVALGLVSRISRPITKGRCARCGTRIERGQTYCMDHLMATVSEAREQERGHVPSRRLTRPR